MDSPIVDHPADLARSVASLLRNDAIMARQIREHIKDEELIGLLEIKARLEQVDLDDEEEETLLAYIVKNFSRADVLDAYKK
jgi:hypothetical protein